MIARLQKSVQVIFLFFLPAIALTQAYPELRMQKFYGGHGDDYATAIRKSLDGNLFLGGHRAENDGESGCSNIWILKVDTSGSVLWERDLGGSGCDELRDIIITPDSGLIFVGITSSFIEHPEKGQEEYKGDYFLGKIDKNGEIDWLKTYGGLDVDQAYGIASGKDGEYVVVGATNSTNFDVVTELEMSNMWMVRFNKFGKKVVTKAFGGKKHDWAYSVAPSLTGGYVFAGFTNSEDIDQISRRTNGDAWIGEFDRYGAVRWQKVYSGKYEDYFEKVIVDKTGRVVAVGNFETEKEGKQFWVIKLTPNGKKMYENIFGGKGDEYAKSISECADGGYIMTGFSSYYNLENQYIKGGEDFWLIKLDKHGNVIWKDTYGGRYDEQGVDVIEYSPGTYYALGSKYNKFNRVKVEDKKSDFWLLKVKERKCEEFDIQVYLSLKEYNATANKDFKCKAIVEKGDAFLWDFGDGTISRERDPVHRYVVPGVYEIKLTVFVNENCAKTYTVPEFIMAW